MNLVSSLVMIFVLFLAHCAPVFAENTDRAKAEAVCSRSDVIFCENWEDGDSVGWGDFKPTAPSDGFGPGYNSAKAVKLILQKDLPDSMYPSAAFNTPVGVNDTLYVRWNAYFSPGFEWNTTNTKHIYLVGLDAFGDKMLWEVPFFFRPQGLPITQAKPYFHFYCGMIEVGPVEAQQCATTGGDLRYFPNVSDVTIDSGKWYTFEFMVRPNLSGQSFGGHISAWVDDQLVIDYDNVSVRKSTITSPLKTVWLTTYFGGGGQSTHPEQYVLYDNLVISKSRIGTGSVPTSFKVAPNGTYTTRPAKMLKDGAIIDPKFDVGTICEPDVIFTTSSADYHYVTQNGVRALAVCK